MHFGIPQWFAGQLYLNTPWYLPFAIVAVTVPVTLLLLAVVGVFWNPERRGTISGKQASKDNLRTTSRFLSLPGSDWTGLHLLGLLTILLYYTLPFTSIHDQDRLLMPAYFHLAALTGEGFAVVVPWLTGIVGSRRKVEAAGVSPLGAGLLGFGLGVLFLAPGFINIVRLHPSELSYYNELIGGVKGAQQHGMEATYFAGTYGHFLPELNRLPAGSKVWVVPNSWDVLYYYQRNGLLRDDIVLQRPSGWGSFYDDTGVLSEVGGLESADYALIERRQTSFNDIIPENAVQLEWAANKPIVALLERDGVVLAALYSK